MDLGWPIDDGLISSIDEIVTCGHNSWNLKSKTAGKCVLVTPKNPNAQMDLSGPGIDVKLKERKKEDTSLTNN